MRKATIICFMLVFVLTSLWAFSANAGKKKVLYVDSYHAEYKPSMIMHKVFSNVLQPEEVEIKFVYMDAKRQKSDKQLRNAAMRVKNVIEKWEPDIVLAADDAASKYLVEPYYKDAKLPFVFIGVNWDVKEYGYPYKNVTGQIEVELISELIAELKKYSQGDRIGFLAGETFTDKKAFKHYQDVLNLHFNKVEFVDNFSDWKTSYKLLQDEVDILIFRNNSGITGWDDKEAKKTILEHTTIPTGTVSNHLFQFVLISYSKMNRELGEYGAKTVLQILNGKSPEKIPISTNKQAKVYLNMKLAKKMAIKFPMERLQSAHMISAAQKKLLFVNSYHKGFKWSDDIEKGLLKALHIKTLPDGTFDISQSEVELRIFRMDTKLNTSEVFKKQAAFSAKTIIDEWQPDIVVTSDDNAAKYLIEPYYKNSAIPFVFCGVSWDASGYGFPVSNVTGMVEVAPILQIMELLKTYAKGNRLGFIGSDNLTSHRDIEYQTKLYGLNFSDGKFVSTFDEWKKEYLRLQNTVDMIMWTNPIGIKGWDNVQALEYILENTKIPSAGTSDNIVRFALLGRVRIAAEQGWWSGNTALRILKGTSPANIPIVGNKESRLFLNMELAKRLKIKFPMELIEEATFLGSQPN